MKYIIGTGWWCDGTGEHTHSKHQKNVDKTTRQRDFFNLWYAAIEKYTTPKKIIVIDSNSPIKPNIINKNVTLYSLDKNYGAALDGTRNQILSGWDRSILLSASMAYFEDIDYFVYIEQDCLIYGKGIIEEAIKKIGNKMIMLGEGSGTPQPIQQSFVIIKKEYIPFFLMKEMNNSKENLKLSPEQRYNIHYKNDVEFLPFGFGRKRPIKFKDKYFYSQHLNQDELKQFRKIIEHNG